ncbi:MAG: S41 family peptidase [Bacteroidales bacterium]|nr:S41 family peptidase [Bacteroidales bacterium]MCM1148214.1 S41 family peptidase [Bacteroidales bacterium]MCM1206955.1 S41 family peptidase [Bacillota bacterium]
MTTGCVNEEEFENTASGNFEALWKIMDEHYCFFSLKEKELGVNWNEVHERYSRQTSAPLSRDRLFEVLGNMLGELKDGHVNMSSSFDMARNWSWREDYPTNLSDTLLRNYLATDYRQTCGMQYRFLDDNVGYVRCSSFEYTLGEGNIDEILFYLAPANGLIIDVRSNGGGLLTSAEKLARRFTNRDITVGYMQHKTGKGHDDFSGLEEQRLTAGNRLRWQKKVVVLTNRGVYSAANEFVKYMKVCGATIIGDRTGGGAGMPFSSELPNGWSVRFSACPMYDIDGNSTEQGIAPDVNVALTDEDFVRGKDTIIEYARKLF